MRPVAEEPGRGGAPRRPHGVLHAIGHHHQPLERGVAHHDGGRGLELLPREAHRPHEEPLPGAERLHQPARARGVAHRDHVLARGIHAPVHEVRHQAAVGHRRAALRDEGGERLGVAAGGEQGGVCGEGQRRGDALTGLTAPLPGAGGNGAILPDRAVLVGVAGGAGEVELAAGEEHQRERPGGNGRRAAQASGPPRARRGAARGRTGRSPSPRPRPLPRRSRWLQRSGPRPCRRSAAPAPGCVACRP